MITLASFEPAMFNNNGDQGNLTALQAQLAAVDAQFSLVSDLENCDFLLIGDSSIAVHEHYRPQLDGLLPTLKLRLLAGKATLIVGRSFEYLAPKLGINLLHAERESKFVKLKVAEHEVFGYHNSTVVEPKFYLAGAFVGTTLFGPVIPKNPSLMAMLAKALGVELTGSYFEQSAVLADKVRESTTF